MSQPFKVLISGGGITGPVTAYWLARASTEARPIHITVLERASATPTSGQGLDVEGPARDIVKRMNLLEMIRAKATGEKGTVLLDRNNRPFATFEQGLVTQDIEIMRGDLCTILTDAAKKSPNVEFRYQSSVQSIEQTDDFARVTWTEAGQTRTEEYGAVIACDGLRSQTRDLILDQSATRDCTKTRDMFVSYFSLPAEPQDGEYSRIQHAVGGRLVWIRPLDKNVSSAYCIAVGKFPRLAESLASRDHVVKRRAWAEALGDIGYGEFPRAIEAMQTTDNFYSDQITQIKLPTWHKGRCAVVGDAAWAPAPITGMGTQLAILGAYIIAGELGKNTKDPAAAFRGYEAKLRKYVEESQEVPLGGRAPEIVCPQTAWGIRAVQTALWTGAKIHNNFGGVLGKMFAMLPGDDGFKVPDYQQD